MYWEIQLTGDTADLQMLSEAMQDGDISICEKEGKYILRARELDNLQNSDEVFTRVEEITRWISGISRIKLGAYKPIKVGLLTQFRDDGKKGVFVQADTGVIRIRAFPASFSVTHSDGRVEHHRPADSVKDWLKVARKNPNVAKALRLINKDSLSWVELYRIYEVIEGDVGKRHIVASGWSTETEISQFKHTANSVAASGDSASHGKETTQPPKDPMSLKQGRAFIDALLKSWIASETGK